MIYELSVKCLCLTQAAFDDALDKLNELKPDMKFINPGQPNQECSFIDVIENRHDESPTAPCTIISHWDNCPVL